MKRRWTEYHDTFTPQPMTFWVHGVNACGERCDADAPPLPPPVAGSGFAVYFVEFDGFTFRFASLIELDTCIETLGRPLLPQAETFRQNSHWLSRLPSHVLPWRYRERAVEYLRTSRDAFQTD